MSAQEITVVYRWTANPGKLDELKSIYENVFKEMEDNEPGTLRMECYYDDEQGQVIVHDVFEDGAALGAHLGGTAAHHFPQLAQIATPGPFFFCGDVSAELKHIAQGMNMGAVFGSHAFGFSRA